MKTLLPTAAEVRCAASLPETRVCAGGSKERRWNSWKALPPIAVHPRPDRRRDVHSRVAYTFGHGTELRKTKRCGYSGQLVSGTPPRHRVAGNPNTPAAPLQHLACDQETKVVSAVACNPATPLLIAQTKARSPENEILEGLAVKPVSPTSSSSSPKPSVVAKPSAPQTLLTELIQGARSDLRVAVTWCDLDHDGQPHEDKLRSETATTGIAPFGRTESPERLAALAAAET